MIQMKKQINLLGVTLDQKLTFKTQTELVCQKMRKRARVLTALAGKDWGSSRKILTSIYKALVESMVWYGAAGWLPWLSKSNLKKLERSQRMALRAVTGLPKTQITKSSTLKPKWTQFILKQSEEPCVLMKSLSTSQCPTLEERCVKGQQE